MIEIFLTYRAEKDVKNLSKELKQRIKNALLLLKEEPLKGEELLRKYKGFRRYRVGDFRIIYEFNSKEKSILVIKIRHRKEVYR